MTNPGGIPARPTECDLVMQGGITSGVAYPAAVLELYKQFRFRSIGGASAGAMAAAVTAAAEYARDSGGFERLEALRQQLQQPGLIVKQFRPSKQARPLFRILLAAQAKRTTGARTVSYLWGLLRWLFLPLLLSAAVAFGLGWLLVASAGGTLGGLGVAGWIVFAVGMLITGGLGLTLALLWSVVRLVRDLPKNYYGMCIGAKQRPQDPDALADWLHKQIQIVAGKDVSDPLTFTDLKAKGINLQLMTTDVTGGRPVRLPNEAYSDVSYLFSLDEWRRLFPAEVLDHLGRISAVVYPGAGELRALPTDDLPVLVATRMSLTFPVLLSAVPLWTVDGQTVARHWFADGGISSNFPIQFFDAWLPTRPTFGLYFGPKVPSSQGDQPPVDPDRVEESPGLLGYLGAILDAGLNWHDTMQARLPGFRERVQAIRLTDGEGGFNLTMPPETIKRIDAKGAAAGQALLGFDFHKHWVERYLIAMRMLQRNLVAPEDGRISMREAYTREYHEWLASGATGTGHGEVWSAEAAEATAHLLDGAESWLRCGETFVDGADPKPSVAMRITPDV
ncbi:patatin-like phospholipase family protein [Kutzneria kofuensis]|uniref:Putative acylesterase/phospholipase RssA n=2 Tax=Kutzneria kofuensis TaxID=103725 RepID=A0A7W9KL43_9PSEU|nr:patatin-like phospholipase family protein [Kutzneria kofuensis]MBB5894583.1 putative acylesterase/phospholipase RssA [Kutzneria kofuensis]